MKRGGKTAMKGDDATKRRRFETLKEQYPMIFAFGEGPIAYLSHEDSIKAGVHDRIKSVWPFLVKQVLRFADTLRPRDLANYDAEDVLGELYSSLVEKDDKWIPTRGRYLTFVGKVVANELHGIRDRAHTVHSPKNASCRLKEYEAEDEAGDLSDRRRKTYSDILRVIGEHEAIENDPLCYATPETAEVAARAEEQGFARQALHVAARILPGAESRVIGQAFGLFGHDVVPLEQIAEQTGRTVDTIKKIKARGLARLRAHLEAQGFAYHGE